MKFAPLLLLCLSLAPLGWAEPAKAPPRPPNLPVIEVHDATPVAPTGSLKPAGGTIELPPIEGQKAEKMTGSGRSYWGGPYGMPGGPGRAWPSGSPPGTPGASGGIPSPGGFPTRF